MVFVLHIFLYFCLEFLYQVGASSANSNPGADEHDGLFWKFITRKTGRDSVPVYRSTQRKGVRETSISLISSDKQNNKIP